MPMQGSLSIERMCQLARVSRAGFYRSLQEQCRGRGRRRGPVCDSAGRTGASATLRLSTSHGRAAAAWHAREPQAGRRASCGKTTCWRSAEGSSSQPQIPNHALEVYLNLARRMTFKRDRSALGGRHHLHPAASRVRLSGRDPGWLFPQGGGLEAGSHACARGWPSKRCSRQFELRRPLPGLVHHSDRGVQYASAEYVAILKQHGMVPSMSRPANPYDNASCESFIKTLKREEIYANEYADLSICATTSRSSSSAITTRRDCTPPWATERQRSSSRKPIAQRSRVAFATVRFFAGDTRKSSTRLLGEGTQTPSLPPHPYPAWRISEMTSETSGVSTCRNPDLFHVRVH